jgi:multiple antibiotic resistance protein
MTDISILAILKSGVLAFVTLFPIVNPLGDAPIFLELTREYPASVQRLLSRKCAAYGFIILAACLMLGTQILAFFGISIPVVQVAGGIVLACTGWRLLNQSDDKSDGKPGQRVSADVAMQSAFYPLTFPLTVDPGSMSVAITIGAHIREAAGGRYVLRLPMALAVLAGMFVLCILVWLCYENAVRLVKFLGETGSDVVARLSSFILMAIGIQIIWNGVSSLWPMLQQHPAVP